MMNASPFGRAFRNSEVNVCRLGMDWEEEQTKARVKRNKRLRTE